MGGPAKLHRLLVAALALVLVVACSAPAAPSGTASVAPKGPPDKVTFLTDFSPFGYDIPFYAGVGEGFFKSENVDFTVQTGAGSADTATKVGAGAAHFGLVDGVTAFQAIGKGTPITVVASHWQKYLGGFCYVAGRREIKSFKDFEGARVGGSPDDSYLRVATGVMKERGFDPNKINFTAMAAAAATTALNANQLDAISCGLSTFPGRQVVAKSQGIDLRNFGFADNGFAALGHQIVVNNALLKSNPDLVQRVVNAYAKSVVWSQLNQDKATDYYMKEYPQASREAEKANFVQTIPLAVDKAAAGTGGQFVVPAATLDKTLAIVKDWYQLTVDPKVAVTNEFALKLPQKIRDGQLP